MSEVEALLDRLVAQFEGPYDFLRELVQNSLDAGSDRAEVALEVHEGDDPDAVVYELRIADAGSGMDEAVIDGGLTRLFASTKADDRTMAGVTTTSRRDRRVVEAEVVDTALVTASPTYARVLVFVNQRTAGDDLDRPTLDLDRVLVTVRRVDGEGKVSELDSL